VHALGARQDPVDRDETVERRRHGRHEHRRVEVFAPADLRPAGWRPHLAGVGRVTRRTWVRDTASGLWRARKEIASYACQSRRDAPTLGRVVRGHWGLENRAHPVRDRILGEDGSRSRPKPGIFARLRSFALNLLRANGVTNVSEAIYTNALSLDRLLAYKAV
jgi:predicted transposase YbfD/YdcC